MPDKSETLEASISRALIEAGGPPELAPQLIAIAEQHGVMPWLKPWIQFHTESEWSAIRFDKWARKYLLTMQNPTEGTK